MADCALCEAVAKGRVLLEDEDIVAILDEDAALPGQAIVMPKKHHTILEQVPDAVVGKVFSLANRVSTLLFNAVGAQGSNLFVENGVSAGQRIAHFSVKVVPRKERDTANLQWKSRQLSEEEMSTIELKVKEGKAASPREPKDPKDPPEEETGKDLPEKTEDNYLWRSWNRKLA